MKLFRREYPKGTTIRADEFQEYTQRQTYVTKLECVADAARKLLIGWPSSTQWPAAIELRDALAALEQDSV